MLKKLRANNYLKISKLTFSLFTSFILFTHSPAFAEVTYPEYTGENVLDMSGKFDNRYSNSLKSELNQSSDDVRVVFLNTKNQINLSFYAPKLFQKWNMSENSILVVIDPYLNKTGYGLGKEVLKKLKNREVVKANQEGKENTDPIDYDNLATAILDKFSPEQVKQEDGGNFSKNLSSDLGLTEKEKIEAAKKRQKQSSLPFDPMKVLISLAVLGGLGAVGWHFYQKHQRLKEIMEVKSDYLFDLNIQKQEIISILDQINLDLRKMSLYKNLDNQIETNIENLLAAKENAESFIEHNEEEIEEINSIEDLQLDDLSPIKEMMKKGDIVKDDLIKIHDESVDIRQSLFAILNKNDQTIAYIKAELDKCKEGLESIRTNYQLTLNISEDKVKTCESYMRKINKLFLEDNHFEALRFNDQSYQIMAKIKKDCDLIPTLYRQLRERMPAIIETTLNLISDPEIKEKTKKEISNLKNVALISLSNGDFENSDKLVKEIFEKINVIRNNAKKSPA